MKIGVSSCLLGINCKYNGLSNYNEGIIKLKEKYELVPICPEVLGGLPTPRIPAEIIGDKVINQSNIDVTYNYQEGAKKALEILRDNNINVVILKSKSPSCGRDKVYDGSFNHTLIDGSGIAAKLFKENNITIYDENDYMLLLNKNCS